MARYKGYYKCVMCDTMLVLNEVIEMDQEQAVDLVGKTIRNQVFVGNPYLKQAPMFIPHKCRNGNAGLAVFAGFKREV